MERISTLTVAKAIVEKFINMISTGELQRGQKLPSQRELARLLHVGMSSLREGLLMLECNGFIEIRRGDGTYVTEDNSRILSNGIEISIQIDTSVPNLLEAGDVIQIEVAGLAAKKAAEDHIARMRACLADIESSDGDNHSISQRYIDFHKILTDSIDNPLLYRINMAIISSVEKLLGEIPHSRKRLDTYWKVVDAVASKDEGKARKIMRKLLDLKRHIYFPE
jgi:GntR family transcriptional repressor for pyruvate dehydrogenase complex